MLSANVLSAAPIHAPAAASVSQAPGSTSLSQGKSTASPHVAGKTVTTVNLDTSVIAATGVETITFTVEVFAGNSLPRGLVAVPEAAAATGTVTFMSGSTVLATESLDKGTASFSTTSLPAGNYSITAVYSGDGQYAGGTSKPVPEYVTAAATTTGLTSSNSSPTPGKPVTLTATVGYNYGVYYGPSEGTDNLGLVIPFIIVVGRIEGSRDAAGTVTFMDGSTVLGTASVSNGVATLTVSALPAGSNSITAVYKGDGNLLGSTSIPIIETVR